MSTVFDRVKKVQEFRRSCSSADTRKYADSPTLPTRLAYYSNNEESVQSKWCFQPTIFLH